MKNTDPLTCIMHMGEITEKIRAKQLSFSILGLKGKGCRDSPDTDRHQQIRFILASQENSAVARDLEVWIPRGDLLSST